MKNEVPKRHEMVSNYKWKILLIQTRHTRYVINWFSNIKLGILMYNGLQNETY